MSQVDGLGLIVAVSKSLFKVLLNSCRMLILFPGRRK